MLSLFINPHNVGALTEIGVIGTKTAIRSLAFSLNDNNPTPIFAILEQGCFNLRKSHIMRVNPQDFYSVASSDTLSWPVWTISGLLEFEVLLGGLFSPVDNEIYVISNFSRVYIIKPFKFYATQVGDVLNCSFVGTTFGVDWEKASNMIRVISGTLPLLLL